jgi:hypothetical protein
MITRLNGIVLFTLLARAHIGKGHWHGVIAFDDLRVLYQIVRLN